MSAFDELVKQIDQENGAIVDLGMGHKEFARLREWALAMEAALAEKLPEPDGHPYQPLKLDCDGNERFVSNRVVKAVFERARKHGLDMNDLVELHAIGSFTSAEMRQFVQLLGYSLTGFTELSFVSDEDKDRVFAEDRMFKKSMIRGRGE